MLVALADAGLVVPKYAQLNNFLSYHRKSTLGPLDMTLREVKEWAEQRSKVPDNPDEVYVANFEHSISPVNFKIFLTTTRLIKLSLNMGRHVISDATYRLITEGYPVLTMGMHEIKRYIVKCPWY